MPPARSTRADPADPDTALLRRLLRAKDRMDAASHEAWPVQRLAAVSDVSETHFARSFKQAFGVPPHRYLLPRRTERSAALVRDTDLPVTEIAFATGWGWALLPHLLRRHRPEPRRLAPRHAGSDRGAGRRCPAASAAPRTAPT